MYITKVQLENIKSHKDSTFEFGPGTTVISGENGAGKTTIIEAIAWSLFNLLDYKKEDFVRRGEKKGNVRVTFVSGLDERLYTVYRDTQTGYYVFDEGLKNRIGEKREEVERFLCKHLGVEPGTDLESLFRRAIGVPQGTFTAIFLEAAAERKRAFDKLLKVEEYRRGSDELLRTSRFVERQIGEVQNRISHSEGILSRGSDLELELDANRELMKRLGIETTECESTLTANSRSVGELDLVERALTDLRSAREREQEALQRARIQLQHAVSEADRSRAAAESVSSNGADAERYVKAVARSKELERERVEREKLNAELAKIDTALSAVASDKRHAQTELERIGQARETLAGLKVNAEKQRALEGELETLRTLTAESNAAVAQLEGVDERLSLLREQFKETKDELNTARSKAAEAEKAQELQARVETIVLDLARLNASLERDQKFQAAIVNGLCPIISQRCLNLAEGESLKDFVTSQFEVLQTDISRLTEERKVVDLTLTASRAAEKAAANIKLYERRLAEIGTEGVKLKEQKLELDKKRAAAGEVALKRAETEKLLSELEDPKSRVSSIERDIVREAEFLRSVSQIEKNLERLDADRRITVEKLESYKDLNAQLFTVSSIRETTESAHQKVVAGREDAEQLVSREKTAAAVKQALGEIEERLARAEASYEDSAGNYDGARHKQERENLLECQKRRTELRVRTEAVDKRLEQLNVELEQLRATRKTLSSDLQEKERLQTVVEATDFIRTTLKNAAPLVARNYVHHVSIEANQMYREITGNPERTLKWNEDYGISLEESGYDRPFANLSGGEQMAAALSVRLAILKQLSDIRIAFFDEPTTNMDAERRENLAMQISQIRHFDQLFVISHDDSFEGYMDHEISLEPVR